MFESVLVANRGEIARRIVRTARRMGIKAIAVYSEADQALPYVREADEALLIGPPPPPRSYLDVAAIIGAARRSGAAAVHPGYGFLAENAGFARRVHRRGADLGRPAAIGDGADGRQDQRQEPDGEGRRAGVGREP